MKLAISNIAWEPTQERDVGAALAELGVRHVEIAPTKSFADPTNVSDAEIAEYQALWADYGIDVVAFQSMFFSRPDLTLFDEPEARAAATAHMAAFFQLAGRMNVGVLVFGSPKNRVVPDGMTYASSTAIAVELFSEWADLAEAEGTAICIEPNPVDYGANFVTTARSGRELVKQVGRAGFGLHLDAAGMTMAHDDVPSEIGASASILRHFHVSAPQLGEISEDSVDHRAAAAALRAIAYEGFISIEMRPGRSDENVERARSAVRLVQRIYQPTIW